MMMTKDDIDSVTKAIKSYLDPENSWHYIEVSNDAARAKSAAIELDDGEYWERFEEYSQKIKDIEWRYDQVKRFVDKLSSQAKMIIEVKK